MLPGLSVAQGDFVGLGDVVGLDGSESHAQALASLSQQLEGVGGGALRGGALRISPVFLDEMGLQGCSDFVGRLQRVVDGPVPCSVVNHGASIAPLRASGVLGSQAERFGMGPAVVLGQDLTEVAGPVGDGAVTDLAAGDRKTGNGHREAAGR